MPRNVYNKSYGRDNTKDSFASRAFDAAMLSGGTKASKAASTIKRFGATSFTSTRGTDNIEPAREQYGGGALGGARKRKLEAAPENDTMFDDPFSFDSDEDGAPKKPKRGMGYKKDDPPVEAKPGPAKPAKTPGSSVIERDENNEEKDLIKNAPSRTYSNIKLMISKMDNGSSSSKQLSIDACFSAKLSSSSSSSSSTSGSQSVPRKFFTSRAKSNVSDNNSQPAKTKDSSAASSQIADAFSMDIEDNNDVWSSELGSSEPKSSQPGSSQPKSSQSGSSKLKSLQPGSSQYKSAGSKSSEPKSLGSKSTQPKSSEQQLWSSASVVRADSPSVSSVISVKSEDNEENNDTDSVCSQQEDNHKPRAFKSYSQHSVASNGSNHSNSSICDTLKWDNRPVIKISNLDRESKKKATGSNPLVRRLLTSPKKTSRLVKKASYNHRQWHDSDDDITSSQDSGATFSQKSLGGGDGFDFGCPGDDTLIPSKDARLKKKILPPARPGFDKPINKVNIDKEHKPLYTVVRNVKQAHECQEFGETQEFQDDIDYIMEGLGDEQSISVRVLSAMTLTNKCESSAFRMHLRAHGILNTIFSKLHDAAKYPSLSLATSSIMFFVSHDRFSMDLEPGTLKLMVELLSAQDNGRGEGEDGGGRGVTSPQPDDEELQRMQARIQETCQNLQNEGVAKLDIHLEEVSSGLLAMESLLSLTSKRAGEWFKEELRTLGGLEHICNTVTDCVADLDEFVIDPTEAMLNRLKKIERCLRVMENITYMNNDNQSFLTTYKNGSILKDLCHTLRVCENCMPFNLVEMEKGKVKKDCPGFIIFTCLLSVLKVLLNITHDNAHGSTKAGQQDQLLKTVLITILRVPQYIPAEERFTLMVLGLGLLINLVEHCDHNRELLIDTHAVQPYDEHAQLSKVAGPMESLEALAKLFLIRYEAARRIEEEHDAKLDEKEQQKKEQRKNAHNKSGEWKESQSGLEWISGDCKEDGGDTSMDVALPGEGNTSTMGGGPAATSDDHDSDTEEATDFTEALHKAGKHMEGCILAAYVALLLGCTIQGNSEHIERVRNCLPEGEFNPMVRMLRKFLGFMNFTSCISGASGSKSIAYIIEVLEAC